jgi:hypothetical protein
MKKKGYIQDFLFIGIAIFVFAVILIVGGHFLGIFNTKYQASGASTEAKAIVGGFEGRYGTVFDWIFVFVLLMLILAAFVSFFLLDTHPALFFIVLFVLGIILIPVGIMSNAFDELTTNSSYSSQAGKMPAMGWIMDNYAKVFGVLGVIGVVLLLAKLRGGMYG